MVACVLTGLAPEGPWPAGTQLAFVLSFGLWQWAYLAPLAISIRRRRPGLALGLALSGIVGMLVSGLVLLSRLLRT